MGTPGHIVWTIDGDTYTHYSHWDGYPSGMGGNIVHALHQIKYDELKEKFAKLVLVFDGDETSAEDRAKYSHLWQNVSSGTDWYSLLREQQGDLSKILENGICTIDPNSDHEYSYHINLDENRFIFSCQEYNFEWPLNDLPTVDEFLGTEVSREVVTLADI